MEVSKVKMTLELGPSEGILPVNLVPETDAPTGSVSFAPVLLSSSAVAASRQVEEPDLIVPGM